MKAKLLFVSLILFSGYVNASYFNPVENLPNDLKESYFTEAEFNNYINNDTNLADFCLYFINIVDVYDSVLNSENLVKHNLDSDFVFKLRNLYVYGATGKDLFMICVSSDNKKALYKIYETYIYAQMVKSENITLQREFLSQVEPNFSKQNLDDFMKIIYMFKTSNLLKFYTYEQLKQMLNQKT